MSKPFREKLYDRRQWRRRSAMQLKAHPMCQDCEQQGRTREAVLSHHIVPHNGNEVLFHLGELRSLCHPCHLRVHGRAPPRGFSFEIALDGWPVDPRHEVYRHEAQR